ncbi:MAG TPA: aspartyl protease family protein, partial [Gemmataceae bacterium]|nr:aspartyl protease family protein [Gemmataceae bacterium]
MKAKGANGVGRFSIDFEVANNEDLVRAKDGSILPDQVRRMMIRGVVDSGATRLVLPESVVKRLGLESIGKVRVRYADRRTAKRDKVQQVFLEILGRQGTYTATVEPNRRTALIGAIVLEDLDLLVDCTHQRLVPR